MINQSCLRLTNTAFFKKTNVLNTSWSIIYFQRHSHQSYKPTNLPSPPEITRVQRKYKKPVDWLPFEWHRRPKFNIFERSGDTIKANLADPSIPKLGFENSEELKTADEKVKKMFSIGSGRKSDMKEICRKQILEKVQRHPNDYRSLEVQIALATISIRALFEHKEVKSNREVHIGRVHMALLIQRRNKLLRALRNTDNDRFLWLLEELQLYFVPGALGVLNPPRYCKKWDLRRMTKDYCDKIIADKKAAYHEELKNEQEDFLKEKEEALAWIAAEEKAIAELDA